MPRSVPLVLGLALSLLLIPGTDAQDATPGAGDVAGTPAASTPTALGTPTTLPCIDFRTMPQGSLPVETIGLQGVLFTVSDPDTRIWATGGFAGLDAKGMLEIALQRPSPAVELALVHFARPATITAFERGSVVGTETMTEEQGVEQRFAFSGTAIDRVVVEVPEQEALLLEFCYRP